MARAGRVLTVATLVALSAGKGYAQAPAKAPAAIPEAQVPADGPPGPPAWAMPAPEQIPYQDRNGPLLKGNPLLDGPCGAPPGWFAAVEVDPTWVHVLNQLAEPVSVGNGTDVVRLPTATLGATVAPRFDVGYRFAQGSGALLASYRFVETTGSADLSALGPAGGPGSLRSRFDLNVLDLDYASREFPFAMGPGWDMKWLAGARLASLYTDSQAAGAGVAQRVTDRFAGVGPHASAELWRFLGDSGLALFGRVDFELLLGHVHQSFTETVGDSSGVTDQGQVQVAPVLAVQGGLGWAPPGNQHLRFALGYTFEDWWDVGFTADASRASATVQGVFLRGEWRY
jgi:hypothetical protein